MYINGSKEWVPVETVIFNGNSTSVIGEVVYTN
jgi:hypothetical protein